MDEHQGPSPRECSLAEETARALDALRARSSTLRADEVEKWNDLEARLNDSIRIVEEEMARSLDAAASQQAAAASEQAAAASQKAAAASQKADVDLAAANLAERELAFDALRNDIHKEQDELAAHLQEQQAEIKHERAELEKRRAELEEQHADLLNRGQCVEQKSAELEKKEAELAEQQRALDARDEHLTEQGQQLEQERTAEELRIAELEEMLRDRDAALAELREAKAHFEADLAAAAHAVELADEKAEQLAQVEQHRAALVGERDSLSQEQAELQKALELATSTRDKLADALAEAQARIEKAEEKLAAQPDPIELEQKFELAMAEARDLRAKNAELEERLAAQPDRVPENSPELVDLRAERDALATRVAELEQRPPASSDESFEQQFDDLQRRFELAVDDVRELKTEKADLEKRLAEANAGSGAALIGGGGLDWEAQKRKLLKSLDEDLDADDEEDRQSRVTIEGTIRITDGVIAEKDREIAEFKRLLEEQSSSIGDVAVGAAAVAELFDQDDAIRQERERLHALQAELQGKLRDAELEFSVQRAKLAREQSDVNTRQQELEEQQAALEKASATDGTGNRKRQWLIRLGLNKEKDG